METRLTYVNFTKIMNIYPTRLFERERFCTHFPHMQSLETCNIVAKYQKKVKYGRSTCQVKTRLPTLIKHSEVSTGLTKIPCSGIPRLFKVGGGTEGSMKQCPVGMAWGPGACCQTTGGVQGQFTHEGLQDRAWVFTDCDHKKKALNNHQMVLDVH